MKTAMMLLLSAAALAVVSPSAALASDGSGNVSMPHMMMVLAMQVGLILIAARLGNMLFEKLRMPGVLGELVAGMIIGPYALGAVPFYGFAQGLFGNGGSFPVSPELYGLASLASIVLLFMVGLETDIRLLMKYSLAGGAVGLGGVVVSFVAGDVIAMLMSPMFYGRQLGFFAPECMFLGVISTATSVGITARILSAKGKMESPEGVTILSGAVIDDVLGIIMLAVVSGMVSAGGSGQGSIDWGHIGLIAAKAVGVWLGATAIGLLGSRKIGFLLKLFGERGSIAVIALGLALLLAGLFEEAGLAMIIGAYVMGVTLSKTDLSHVIREKIHPISEFLVPIFFCVMGMLINFSALTSSSVIIFGLVYSLVAVVAKLLGCGLPALLLNFNLRGAARIGTGMIPRGEVALIIAGFALSNGYLNDDVFAAAIIMTFVTTILAPPALVGVFHSPAKGTRKEIAAAETLTTVEFEFPSIEMTEFLVDKLWNVLEIEGFYVHRIGHEQRCYQARKDTTIIDIRYSATHLSIQCSAADVGLVNIAVSEAAAALEQTVRGLREPLDSALLRTRILQAAQTPHQFQLATYLSPALVEPNLAATTKNEVIDELLEILARNRMLQNVQSARNAVLLREASMSTGLQHGVAIPHGRTDAVDHLVCAVGIKRDGLDFEALDGQPSTIFILTLSPADKPAPHVQFMSAVSQALDDAGRQRVLAATTRQELFDALTKPT